MANEATTRAQVASTLGLALRAAQAREREDLVAVLGTVRARLAHTDAAVVVAGDYQQGKTALIGALLGLDLPAGPLASTAEVTVIAHGEERSVAQIDGRTLHTAPRGLLEKGLRFLDTPGLGVNGSVDAAVGEIAQADAVVFVTGAGRELTASELWYLRTVRPLVARIAVVVTSTDVHPHWRAVVTRTEEQLREVELVAPVLPVGVPLRRLALERGDQALAVESGFGPVHEWCLAVATDAATLREDTTLRALADVLTELIDGDAEAPPPEAERKHPGGWQQVLNDRLADLGADVEHFVRARARALQRRIETHIDESDPAEVWDELVDDLSRDLAEAVVETESMLRDRMVDVAEAVAAELGGRTLAIEGHDAEIRPDVDRPDLLRESIAAQSLTALRGSYSGLAITAMAGQLLGLTILGPAAVAVGMVIGTKTVRDDRRRQLTSRRSTAKQALRTHLDDVQLEWSKDVRDRLRVVARELRDHFTAEAQELATRPGDTPEPVTTAQLEALRTRVVRLRDTRDGDDG